MGSCLYSDKNITRLIIYASPPGNRAYMVSLFLFLGENMTVKEIAQAVNKTERTVQNWVKKTSEQCSSVNERCSLASPSKPADFDLNETITIIETGLGKNAAALFAQSAKTESSIVKQNNQNEVLMQFMSNMQKQQNEFMTAVLKALNNNQSRQLEYKQDYYSIIGYANNIKLPIAFSEAIKLGKEAANISRENNIEIRKIPDERFGYVNSYHIEVLKKVFEL